MNPTSYSLDVMARNYYNSAKGLGILSEEDEKDIIDNMFKQAVADKLFGCIPEEYYNPDIIKMVEKGLPFIL